MASAATVMPRKTIRLRNTVAPVSRAAAVAHDPLDDGAEQHRRHHHPHRLDEGDAQRPQIAPEGRGQDADRGPRKYADQHLDIEVPQGAQGRPTPDICAKRIKRTDHCI
ncbi:hypothetical protein QE363_001386 [Sphingomonas sp. SORGH_AS870]|nr:hypothetical protein [Sphingomonas sp. SORGH_AS_0870]MDR6145593.1 hypothetical protein [Sphingomonas sp. SORGH_AS_0870]